MKLGRFIGFAACAVAVWVESAAGQAGSVFPPGAAVEARLVSNAGRTVGGIVYFRPDFAVWLQVRVRNSPGGANLGVGRVTGPSASVPASITLTGQGTLERAPISSDSGLRGRAADFRMLNPGPSGPDLSAIESPRANGNPDFIYGDTAGRASYSNGFWTSNSIRGIDAIRAGAILRQGSAPTMPESWSQYTPEDGQWSQWQNVYRVSVVGAPATGRFTISAVGSASIMTGTMEFGAAGVYAVGAASTGLRAFSTSQTFQFLAAIPPVSSVGPVAQPQPSGPRAAFSPSVIPAPGPALAVAAVAGLGAARRRRNPAL